MSNIVFDDEMGRIQCANAQTHDSVVRRNTIMETLNLRTGENVLELGCGGGSYAFEAASLSVQQAASLRSTSAPIRLPPRANVVPVSPGCNVECWILRFVSRM